MPEQSASKNDPLKVLIVDDSPEDREVMRRLLLTGSKRSYQFIESDNGKDGLRACLHNGEKPPDCILLDFHLPDYDAPEFLLALGGSESPRCPVVVVTGLSGGLDGTAILRLGAQDFIGKGWMNSESLTRSVENAIERFAMNRSLRKKEHMLSESQRIAHIGSWIYALDGSITWSEESYTLWGVSPDTFTPNAESFENLIHVEDRPAMQAWITACLAGENPDELVIRRILPDGSLQYLCGRGELKRDAEGKPVHMAGTVQDITERKQAQLTLKDSEERLRLALDAAQMGIFDWDIVHNHITWSPRHQYLWGFGTGDFTPRYDDFASRVHPEDLPLVENEMARCRTERVPYTCEYRVIWPDGSLHWVNGRGEFAYDENGQPLRMRGTVVETTELKQKEEALREHEIIRELYHRLNHIASRVPGVIYQYKLRPDDSSCFPYASEAIRDIYRVKPEDVQEDASVVFGILHPDDYDGIVASIQQSAATLQIWKYEYRVRFTDGTVRWLAGNAIPNPEKEPDGSVIWHGFITDITDIKQAEQSLRESEKKFSKIFQGSPIGIAISSAADGKFIDANAAFLDIYGYEREEIIGHSSVELGLWDNLQHREAIIKRVLNQGFASNIEVKYHRKSDNISRVLLASMETIDVAGEPCMMGFVIDITDRKRAHEYLQESERKFRLSSQRLAQLIWGTNVGTWEWTIPTGDVQFNERWAEMLGYTLAELEPVSLDTWIKLAHPDDLQRSTELLERCFSREIDTYELEARMRHKNGDWVWVLDRGRVVEWSVDGQPLRMSGAHQDITERKQAEMAIAESSNLLQTIISTAPIRVFWKDQNLRYLGCNINFAKDAGMTHPNDVIGKDDFQLAWVEQAELYRADDRLVIESGIPKLSYDEPQTTPKGETIWLRTSKVPLRHPEGEIFGMLGIYEDITRRKELEIQLIVSKAEIEDLYDHAPCAYHSLGPDGTYQRINATELAWLGCSREEVIGKLKPSDFFTPAGKKQFKKAFAKLKQYGHAENVEYDLVGKQGITRHVSFSGSVIKDADGQFLATRSVLYDISELKKVKNMLEQLSYEQQAMLDNELIGIVKVINRRIIWKNKALDRIFGYGPTELKNKLTRTLYLDDSTYQSVGEAAYPVLEAHGVYRTQLKMKRKDGKKIWIDLSGVQLCGGRNESLWSLGEITEIKEYQYKIEEIAFHDALTGLPNRLLTADRLGQALAQANRTSGMLAVCYLDLDGFKPVNDTYSHAAGDKLLIEIAHRLKSSIRANDTAGRLGGDEFVLLLTDLDSAEEYQTILHRVAEAIKQPVMIDETHQAMVTASIGVALFPQDATDADTLLRHADQAMYVAKQLGRDRCFLFDADQDAALKAGLENLASIRRALDRQEFVLHFQPKVNMKTKTVIGVEALIRWQHPERGLLKPADFLPFVKSHPLCIELGDWVLDTVFDQMAEWHGQGFDIPVSVNVDAYHLQCEGFALQMQERIATHPSIPPNHIELEVLETYALNDLVDASKIMHACRKIGVNFVLDDFGTGYSSLTYLKHLPLTMLKIDQTFIHDMLNNPEDLSIVEGVIGLARAFHHQVIAEGVETAGQGELLLTLGCDLAQGYAIAEPMPGEKMQRWVNNWQKSRHEPSGGA